jgi:hypothetical protein
MKGLFRKLRGAVGVGLTWAVGWAVIIFLIGTVIGIVDPDSIDAGEEPLRIALTIIAPVGLISGLLFAAIMSLTERHKSVHDLSLIRAALWGALGAAVLPLLTPMNDAVLSTVCPLGALFAAGTVALARHADRRDSQAAREPEIAAIAE